MTNDVWLTDAQHVAWRRLLRYQTLLPAVLHRRLQDTSGLSLQDFDVLVALTESPDRRLRVLELARTLQWERSRLSRHVMRMQRRGHVDYEKCLEDGRGSWIVLTDDGARAIADAAPDHVAAVRELVFDTLTGDEVADLSYLMNKLVARLEKSEPDCHKQCSEAG